MLEGTLFTCHKHEGVECCSACHENFGRLVYFEGSIESVCCKVVKWMGIGGYKCPYDSEPNKSWGEEMIGIIKGFRGKKDQ